MRRQEIDEIIKQCKKKRIIIEQGKGVSPLFEDSEEVTFVLHKLSVFDE
jgi:hypothetical protein